MPWMRLLVVVAYLLGPWFSSADPAELHVPALLAALDALRNEHNVEVILLGFGTSGESFAESLQPFLDDAARSSGADAAQHVQLLYRAHVGLNSLGSSTEAAITKAVKQEGLAIKHSAVESILSDYTRQAGTASYTFYVLKGGAPNLGPYAYIPDTQQHAGNSSQCGTVGGWGRTERFLWLDLGATARIEPRLFGGGILSGATLRQLDASADVSTLVAASASLASTVHRAVSRLASAQVRNRHSSSRKPSVVGLVRVCARGSCDWGSATTPAWRHVMTTIEALTGAPPLLRSAALQESPALVAAVASSTKARRVGNRRDFILDSTALLQRMRVAGPLEETDLAVPTGVQVVPVYLLDLDTDDALLLEGAHASQAVAVDGAVLAVQSMAGVRPSDLSCGTTGPVKLDPADASCATLYALLKAIWGALPLNQVWNDETGHASLEHLWSRGGCELELPFYLRDAPMRLGALSRWENVVMNVSTSLQQAEVAGVEIGASPLSNTHDAEQHWVGLSRGLEKASRYIGLHKYSQAEVELSKAESAAAGFKHHLRSLFDRAAFFAKPKCA